MNIIQEYYNNELFSHILTEFRGDATSNDSIFLTESHGYYDETENIVDYVLEEVERQIYDFCVSRETKTYISFKRSNINGYFFDGINVDICLSKNTSKKYSARDYIEKMFIKKNGGYEIVPSIGINVAANKYVDFKYIVSFALAHELTHCYNAYAFWRKTGKILDSDYISGIGYPKKKSHETFNQEAVRGIMYKLHRLERNAYIAQLRQELLMHMEEIKDARSGMEVLRKTCCYKDVFMNLEENIENIMTIDFSDAEKEELLDAVNEYALTNFHNFERCKKYLFDRWQKWSKKFMIQSSKIIYDIYVDNENRALTDTSDNLVVRSRNRKD